MNTPTQTHDIIVIGASAGGIDALQRLCSLLPAELPAVICIVQHTAPSGPGMLAHILARMCAMPVITAEDGTPPSLGSVYVAPPDRHLLMDSGRLVVVRGPRENLHRPAIDPLFRSAAVSYGPRVAGVVLTGMLDDGTAGLYAIHQRGGVTLVQDPNEAQFASMPASALACVPIDHCLAIAALAGKLVELAGEEVGAAAPMVPHLVGEAKMATGTHNDPSSMDRVGRISFFTCPECHGTLWELNGDEILRYRCHVGHAFSAESLREGQSDFQERILWTALRALEEQSALLARMGKRSQTQGNDLAAQRFQERSDERRHDADTLREMLAAQLRPISQQPGA